MTQPAGGRDGWFAEVPPRDGEAPGARRAVFGRAAHARCPDGARAAERPYRANVRRSRTITWCSKAVVRLSDLDGTSLPRGRGYEECMLMKSTGEMRSEPVLEQVNYARAGQCCINRKVGRGTDAYN